MSNQQIAKLLRNVAIAYSIKDENKFRFQIIAYNNAADAIASSTQEITDLIKDKKAINLPGVGPSIASHLEELCEKGKSSHFDWVFKGIPDSVFKLAEIPGFGPKKAFRLANEFHIKNPETAVAELEKIAKEGKIETLSGFGTKSQAEIIRAIDDYKIGKIKEERMPLPYASKIAEKIIKYLERSEEVVRVEALGSLRRELSTIGDIDLAVASQNPQEVLKYFTEYPYKERVIEKGEISASITVSGGHQVDLMVQPPESFGSLLQHFTGSKNHNVHLREYALKKGLSLSEYGIKNLKTKKTSNFETEEKFYEALGLDWIPPEIREDTGEIELAITHSLPKLLEREDIKGDLHTHSNYPIQPSHDLGKNSMENMLKKAQELNYEYLGFSEHNPSVSKHSPEEIKKLLIERDEALEDLKTTNKFVRIIKLLEVDITPNGDLAIPQACFGLLDAVIVSIHSSFNMNRKEMTDRIISGLSHSKAKILGHPTGRLINERDPYDLEWERILTFCKKNNKALEINSWPNRLDISEGLIKMAIDYGVKLIINTDSHAAWQMDMINYGVALARKGWAKKDDILNTLPYNELMDWLKS